MIVRKLNERNAVNDAVKIPTTAAMTSAETEEKTGVRKETPLSQNMTLGTHLERSDEKSMPLILDLVVEILLETERVTGEELRIYLEAKNQEISVKKSVVLVAKMLTLPPEALFQDTAIFQRLIHSNSKLQMMHSQLQISKSLSKLWISSDHELLR
jgi:hypothetical protein